MITPKYRKPRYYTENMKIFSLYEESVLTYIKVAFRYQVQGHFMGKKVKLEKNEIVPKVIYFHTSQNSVICCLS